jgi:hypothetical protein
MSSGIIRADFFSKQVIGAEVYETDIFLANQSEIRDAMGRIIGECVVDGTFSGLGLTVTGAINNRLVTVTGDLACQNDAGYIISNAGNSGSIQTVAEGARTLKLHDPTWYSSLPFENTDGTTYRVYLSEAVFPVTVGIARDGSRGYSRAVNAVGITINPSSVTDEGSYLELTVNEATLNALGIQMWNLDGGNQDDETYSYDCVVWLDTDQVGVTIQTDDSDVAIALDAKLVMSSTTDDLIIKLDGLGDGKLGQSVASTTATDYKIVVLGPIITTTDFDGNEDYIHIGTIASATLSDTTDTTGQRVVISVSDAITQSVETPDELFHNGWIVAPTSTASTSQIDVTSTGEAFVNGIVNDTAIQSGLAPVSNDAMQYVYFAGADGDFNITDDAAIAFGDNNIPLVQGLSDGSGDFLLYSVNRIPRRTRRSNLLAEFTVSGTLADRCAFVSLEEALAYAVGLQASVGASTVGVEIELRGDVVLTGAIDNPEIYALSNVIIRGRHHPVVQRTAGINDSRPGSRIEWSHTGGAAFDVSGAGASMRGWKFENIEFRYTDGANTNHAVAVVRTTSSSDGIDGLTFHECTVDGNTVMSAQGGASGRLAHLVLIQAGICRNITVRSSAIYTHGAMIYNQSGSEGLIYLRVNDCFMDDNNEVPALSSGGAYGGIVDEVNSTSDSWFISKNRGADMTGPFINAVNLNDSFIDHNEYKTAPNATVSGVIKLGGSGSSNCFKLMIDHNRFEVGAAVAGSVISIESLNPGDMTGIMIDHNIIDGGDVGVDGITVSGYATGSGFVHGVMLSSNMIYGVETAVVCARALQTTVNANVIQATVSATDLSGDQTLGSGMASFIVANNSIEMAGATCTAFDHAEARNLDSITYNGNFIDMTAVTDTAKVFDLNGPLDSPATVGPRYPIITSNTVVGGTASTVDRAVEDTSLASPILMGNKFIDAEVFVETVGGAWIGNTCLGIISSGVTGWDEQRLIGNLFLANDAGEDITLDMAESYVIGCIIEAADDVTLTVTDSYFIGCRIDAGNSTVTTLDAPNDAFFIGCELTEPNIDGSIRCTFVGSTVGSGGPVVLQNNSDAVAFVGSRFITTLDAQAGSDDVLVVGSYHNPALSFDQSSATFVGNRMGGVTLEAASSEVAFVGNITSVAVTDNGTDNEVANNVDT